MKSGIYKIKNSTNSKIYIGSALDLSKRWSNHKSDLNRNKHSNKHLQRSWLKYGPEAFSFQILEYCEKEKLIEREQHWIDFCKPEYNLNPMAGSNLGRVWSKEVRENMRQARLKLPKEFLISLGKRTKGRKHTEEWKKAQSERSKGNKHNLGRKQSSELIAKRVHARKVSMLAIMPDSRTQGSSI